MTATLTIVFVSGCALSRRICALPDDDCMRTIIAADVGTAIAHCREEPPDSVLFDADGDAAIDAITALTLAQTAPVIAMSSRAWPGSEQARQLMAAGARALLPKLLGPLPLFMAQPEERSKLAVWLRQFRPSATAIETGRAA